MKRTAFVALSLVLASSVLGEETHRYLIGTRDASRPGRFNVAADGAAGSANARNVVHFGVVNGFAADLTAAEAEELRKTDGVRLVSRAAEWSSFDAQRVIGGQTLPNGIAAVKAPLAWKARIAAEVNVVVLDTGVDYFHPDLAYAYVGGYDFVNKDADPMDDHGHGTHVAGTILARNDKQGVVGVAPGVRLHALKVLSNLGKGTDDYVIQAIDWVLNQKRINGGRWVLNLSLGGPETTPLAQEAFAKAGAEGVIVVAASGNASSALAPAPVMYPAAFPSVTAVGAISESKQIATFSCQGPELDFVAPGVGILSSVPRRSTTMAFVKTALATLQTNPVEGSKQGQLTGPYVYVGLGKEGEITRAKVEGKIALIQRGEITFAEKTKRAKENGAIGVAIFNNEGTYMTWTVYAADDPTTQTYAWPLVVSMPRDLGETLAAANTGTLTIGNVADDFAEKSGTSMASPHVAGVAALLWSIAPDATATTIVNAMTTTAVDLGAAGADPVYGAGAVDVHAAARQLAPGSFTEAPPAPGRPTTGRRYLKR
jgi:serine protease